MDKFTLVDYDAVYGALAWKSAKRAKGTPAPLGDLAFFLAGGLPSSPKEYLKRLDDNSIGYLVLVARWYYEDDEEPGVVPDYYTLYDPVVKKDYSGFATWYSERGPTILQLELGDTLPALDDQLCCGPKYCVLDAQTALDASTKGRLLCGGELLGLCGGEPRISVFMGKQVPALLAAPSEFSAELVYPDVREDEEGAKEETAGAGASAGAGAGAGAEESKD